MTRFLQPRFLSICKPQVPSESLFQSFYGPHGRSKIRVTEIVPSRLRLLPNRIHGFRTFCTNEDLTIKKCVPCNAKDLRPMTEESAHTLMKQVEGWELVSEDGTLKLRRSMKVKTFLKGLELFRLIGDLAESEGHHPDLHLVGWNNVKIEIWTHAIGGLTENDFILAAKINRLNMAELLRRQPSR